MSRLLRTVNRVLLGLAGLVLICVGGAVLAAGLSLSVPSWWPWYDKGDVLLSQADRDRWRGEGWWWPTVIAVLAVVVVLALWWLLAQLRRARLAEVLVDSGDGEGALLRGRALEGVLAQEAGTLDGVARAQVTLTGRRSSPHARIRLLMEPHAAPDEALGRLTDEALAHARDSAGLAELPAEVRLRAVKHRAERVS
ncbi:MULTISPECIES: alkaline shock response membrane anchor protein AmaP [unclassified Streptomyces]|uniref:alkaline shock response membrane anchor protein AmaP n=1 Tax=unclassified Streptomyces TaxID=2593676 RepID=UPI0022522D3A|nr:MULTISPECIES: alkaline shock response membrane anchor protein AmaP [unclassified Streptomyces]WSP54345.1 alkaline shock response membrane anchor protein AmaP [Streptomyces sp. NBC_01241]WSU24980.1 alkaline shock response membrane anchor protein AmaP [Streptomyces sp. NBC_01108]MCX4785867.1 alkaline shock response membrane anchor protein AmaP [Streptomyces sp. NBC_01221]MCX4798274.1 alkaline shock response membrane anchor protein AmaP [Streptomyces sp. NBC_01242]WSJ39515.1 alkaline shock res